MAAKEIPKKYVHGGDGNHHCSQQAVRPVMKKLESLALALAASHAATIAAADICVQDELALICMNGHCENYGVSASCPPFVTGPAGFRSLLKKYRHALVFKIEALIENMLSTEGHEIFKLLHQIAASVEIHAIDQGYTEARAFAGGSCKKLFCRDHQKCRVLSIGDKCRYPHLARPSMSGFGINVKKMLAAAGWDMADTAIDPPDPKAMGSASGLVLIC